MTTWATVLVASGLAFLLKLVGFVIPRRLLAGARTGRVVALLPVALLTALIVVQAFSGPSGSVVVDARGAAVAVAVLALVLRAPFLLVVVLAAGTAAALRALGVTG